MTTPLPTTIDKRNFCIRKTLESWHTAITSEADNNAKQLPRDNTLFYCELQISILFLLKKFFIVCINSLFTHFTVYISCSHFLFITCQRLQTGNQKLIFKILLTFNQRMLGFYYFFIPWLKILYW